MGHKKYNRKFTVTARPELISMNSAVLNLEIRFLRQRLGYWRDKAEDLAYQVELGHEDPEAVTAALAEISATVRRFVDAVQIRNNRRTSHQPSHRQTAAL